MQRRENEGGGREGGRRRYLAIVVFQGNLLVVSVIRKGEVQTLWTALLLMR